MVTTTYDIARKRLVATPKTVQVSQTTTLYLEDTPSTQAQEEEPVFLATETGPLQIIGYLVKRVINF